MAGTGVGNRLFNVYCNGTTLLRSFDIFKEAGGENRAVDKTFHGLQPNAQGKLILTLEPVKDYASVNAIEVIEESMSPSRKMACRFCSAIKEVHTANAACRALRSQNRE